MNAESINTVRHALVSLATPRAPAAEQGQPAGSAPADRSVAEVREKAEQRPKAADPAEVEEMVRQLNELVHALKRDLKFNVDDATGRSVVKVLDADTREVIRQIPAEEVLRVARQLQEHQVSVEALKGMLFCNEA